jgi:hypothetical protein
VAIWRQLNKVRALNLHHSLWAIKHGESGDTHVRDVLHAVENIGGEAITFDVTPVSDRYIELEGELAVACEHLWDPFFNEVDRLSFRMDDQRDPSLSELGVAELRGNYAETVRRDISRRDGARRASRRLAACETRYAELFGEDVAPAPTPGARARLMTDYTSWLLDDGSVDYLYAIQPTASIGWERAFNAFEAAIYLPSPARVPLRHGLFAFRCAPAERAEHAGRCADRIHRFESSLA